MLMKLKHLILFAILLGAVAITLVAVRTLMVRTPSEPLEGSDQLVLVLTKTTESRSARLFTYDRTPTGWDFHMSADVMLGENGLAWGRGLHTSGDMPRNARMKREGDESSPAGAFPLLHAYGYNPEGSMRVDFPYTQATETSICCDDPRSRHYARIVDITEQGLDTDDLPSHEKMRRDDNLYKYAILVGHNTVEPKPGAGSCIFIHVWRGPGGTTAGCTAMDESRILPLLAWLRTGAHPVLVQLPRKDYVRLKTIWGLPDVVF